jgi:hypothetical protein
MYIIKIKTTKTMELKGIRRILDIYENKNCSCCNDPMIEIGTKVIIVDNFNDHPYYKEGEILKITEHDDYGNYILDDRYTCSEGEIMTLN